MDYLDAIQRFSSARVLVVGDCILDIFLRGTCRRISPEAPVPVVDVKEEVVVAGGAGNTALNMAYLGAHVDLLSVWGQDAAGTRLTETLLSSGVGTALVHRTAERFTMQKTRVLAGSHLVTRFDTGTDSPLSESAARHLIHILQSTVHQYDVVVIADYGKGVMTDAVCKALAEICSAAPVCVAVDARDLTRYHTLSPRIVKPNYEETIRLLNLPPCTGLSRIEQLQDQGQSLYKHTGAALVAATLDADGALIFQEGSLMCRALALPCTNPQVAGAGDVFISVFTLATWAGATVEVSATLASTAASMGVRQEATAVCTQTELQAYFMDKQKAIESPESLAQCIQRYRREGKRIVMTNGCFDILHSGHVSYLNRARSLGDVLIVGVNHDESVRRLKGSTRPINRLSDRIQVLCALEAVSHVIPFGIAGDDTPISLIRVVQPDIFVKGGDYTRAQLPEAETVEAYGGEIILLSLVPDHSTTAIVQQIYRTSPLAVA